VHDPPLELPSSGTLIVKRSESQTIEKSVGVRKPKVLNRITKKSAKVTYA